MKKISILIRNTNIYLISSILQSVIPFLALPLITKYIAPSDYALIGIFTIVVSFMNTFIGLNTHGAIGRQYVERSQINFPSYVGNSFYIFIGTILIAILITYLFIEQIAQYTKLTNPWIYMALFTASIQFSISIYMTLLLMKNRAFTYGIFNIVRSLFNTITILLFVLVFHAEWEGYLIASMIVTTLAAIFAFLSIIYSGDIEFTYNKSYIKNAISFGLPLVPHAIAGIAIAMTDRILLINLEGQEATGLYQLAWQFIIPIAIIIEAFKNAYIPWLFEKLKLFDMQENIKIVKVTYLLILGIILFSFIYSYIAIWFIHIFMNSKYHQASEFIIWLAIGQGLNGAYYTVGLIISFAEKTSTLAILTFISAGLNLVFSYYLIQYHGMVGAAEGTFFAFLLTFLLTWWLASRVHKMPWILWRKT